jgi:HD-like signal output (HDOD) protein/CheY-like chemotaxis protein
LLQRRAPFRHLANPMKNILFVDDERKVLDGLKRLLFPYGDEWQMEFACGGAEALVMLAASRYDVIVADMRMPGMDGAMLLKEVERLYPEMVRMILSGTWEQDLSLQAAMVAHQYLSKPCDPEVLKATLDRAFALRDVLVDPALRALISSTVSLPSTPAIYSEIIQALRSPEASAQQIGSILARDMGMTAKVLQLVNSAFFGLRRHLTGPEEAVMFLGVDTIKALALSVSAFSAFNASKCPRFSIDDMQRHSTAVGSMARAIAKSQKLSKQLLDDTFVAGLLHDVGQLVLVSNHPEKYNGVLSAVAAGDATLAEAERKTFCTTHAEVGSYLLWLWGLPDAVVEAVAFHHNPSRCPAGGFAPLTAVYVASMLEDGAGVPLDTAYLTRIGTVDTVEAWSSIASEQLSARDTT